MRHRSALVRLALMAMLAPACGTAILDPISKTPPPTPNDGTGLLAHWTFDEKAGTVARDSSQFQRDGVLTVVGNGWVPGRFSGGLSLKRGDRVTVANFPAALMNLSLSFWVRFSAGDLGTGRTSMIGNESGGGGWDLNAPDGSNPPMIQFAFPTANGGGGPGGGHESIACCTPTIDTWLHITATFDAPNRTISIFQGAMKRGSVMANNLIQPSSTTTLTIGGTSGQFQGTVDEIRIYDRVLTQPEIAALDVSP